MRLRPPLIAVIAALGLAACAVPENQTYPITGNACSADDPVLEFGATDCTPVAGTGIGTM